MAHPWLHIALFMDTIGLLLLGMGLFSSQWICFLVVLAMSFSQSKSWEHGGVPGQSGYDHRLRFRHPECISLGMKKREPAHTIRSQLPHTIMMQI